MPGRRRTVFTLCRCACGYSGRNGDTRRTLAVAHGRTATRRHVHPDGCADAVTDARGHTVARGNTNLDAHGSGQIGGHTVTSSRGHACAAGHGKTRADGDDGASTDADSCVGAVRGVR